MCLEGRGGGGKGERRSREGKEWRVKERRGKGEERKGGGKRGKREGRRKEEGERGRGRGKVAIAQH